MCNEISDKLILGIESSCDETAAAVVADGRRILSNVIASQVDIHKQFGGVVPEIASRQHVEQLVPVIQAALEQAGVGWQDLSGLAVTAGPGLIGALLTGVSAAKGIALATRLPLYPVHHIAGHIAANYLADPDLKPPFLSLVASGGHTLIIRVETYTSFKLLASTRDDAAGEAFDKVARSAGLGYPGGPLIDRIAATGNPRAIRFPTTDFGLGNLDFSFSGLKTAALNYLNHNKQQQEQVQAGAEAFDKVALADFAASFREAVVGVLVDHLLKAAAAYPGEALALSGGVAANSRLRELLQEACRKEGRKAVLPALVLCTDNAAMIASMGYYMQASGCPPAGDGLDARASLPLDQWEQLYG